MPIEIADLNALDPTAVQENLVEVAQRLQEAHPTLDLKRGVVHDIVAYLHAQLATGLITNLNRYLSARSLLDIQADMTLADPSVVDSLLSNYRIVRGTGSNAVGEVTLVLTGPFSVTIGSGANFTANGKTFVSDAAYTAKSEAANINDPSDRLLVAQGDGTFAFTINVTATEAGTESLIRKDTLVVPAALPTGYLTSFATQDFTDGLDPETNQELLDKLQQGIASKAPSNRVTMQAMLSANPAFSRIIRSSIVGYGDAEMLRDKHTIFPVACGGRADWYVRTQERVTLQTMPKTCTLLSKDGHGHGTWAFTVARDDAPGFYEVASVLPLISQGISGTLSITSDARSLDLSGPGFVPDILTIAEGAYSRFQTTTIQFVDTTADQTALSIGSTQDYSVTFRVLPMIGDVQDYVSDFANRSYGADVLVKAPIPCFMKISFDVDKNRRQSDPDVSAIAAAVAKAVNTTDFGGRLYASRLQDVIQSFLPEGMNAGGVDMFGRLRWPSGEIHFVRDDDVLVVTGTDGSMVSDRTVQFFAEPEDVTINVQSAIPVPA